MAADIRIAIHQPNLIPWFPYFYKMALVDKFVILRHVQFVRGYQNRYRLSNGRWVTKSIEHTHQREMIVDKKYNDGQDLWLFNMKWIYLLKDTLGIDTELVYDVPLKSKSTRLLIDLIKIHEGNIYVTNADAREKYLDEELMHAEGIKIEYCEVPKQLQKHTFEIFEEYGLDGAIKQLPQRNTALNRVGQYTSPPPPFVPSFELQALSQSRKF